MSKPKTRKRPRAIDDPASALVEGARLTVSLNDFMRVCAALIQEEQTKPLPNNAIIATLCIAVRLAREHGAPPKDDDLSFETDELLDP